MTAWLLLVLSGALIVACGVFVAGEFALLTADRTAVEAAAAGGDRRAEGVLVALRTLSTQLSGVQVAITLTNLAIGFLSEPALAELLRSPLRGLGLGDGAVEAVAVGVALVLSTVLTMIFGELVPKNLAIALPLPVARAVQGPVRAFTRVARLPIRALNAAANVVLGLVGLEAQEELAAGRSPDELLSLVRHSARKGTLDQGTASLLVRSLTFGGKRARDVLTARPLMVTVAASASVAEVLDVVRTSGHARLPVTGPAGLDEVVGVIELDQAVAVEPVRRSLATAAEVMSAVLEVPESLPLDRVLAELQRARTQVALVVDEYGGTAGWLTGEDLLEELVGELDDEHDSPSPAVRALSDGYDVPGLLRPDEVTALTGLVLPAQGIYETVGGLVMQRLARIPVVGDRVVVDGVALTVAAMDGHRVERLHVTAVPDEGGSGSATDGGGA